MRACQEDRSCGSLPFSPPKFFYIAYNFRFSVIPNFCSHPARAASLPLEAP
jgi:hypothetical protein